MIFCYFLNFFKTGCFFGAVHFKHVESTKSLGLLNWVLFRCSSTSLGVTQTTCWPFQYFTMFKACNVLIISCCVMLVIWLQEGRKQITSSGTIFVHCHTMAFDACIAIPLLGSASQVLQYLVYHVRGISPHPPFPSPNFSYIKSKRL